MSDVLGGPITSDPSDAEKQLLAEAIVEEIERPEKGDSSNLGSGAGGWLPELDLPSFGEMGETCGEERTHFCSDCGAEFEVGRTCAKSMCPRCWAAWVLKRAGTSREAGEDVAGIVAHLQKTAKMMSSRLTKEAKEAADDPEDVDPIPVFKHHVVISPLMDDWFLKAKDPLARTFEVISAIMDHLGMEGVVFYHPWRGRHEDHEGGDMGEWKKRIGAGREWDDVRADLIPWGHFHIVGCAPWVTGGLMTKEIERETGWIIKRCTRYNSSKSLADMEDVARAVTYCLSHTGIDTSGAQNKAAYRKFGSTYHSGRVSEDDKDEADRLVRKVVPKTLGIPAQEVTCYNELPADEVRPSLHNHGLDEFAESGEGDGPGAADVEGAEEIEEPTGQEPTELVPCNGRIYHIREAESFLSNEEWRERAPYAEVLQSTFEEWKNGPPDS